MFTFMCYNVSIYSITCEYSRKEKFMSLLKLKDIGKIYVSDGNVSVGIRGVSLEFDRGEFVAVTGKSGSGKSTLLNVISGMDSYEEGELIINGNTTSHYVEADRETYREKYISFIFQDYNIIESYTVLENVELALMHIENKKERRARAKELLDRVGMTKFLRHKGSKLSGGQKQRTVIARALAKDSPIILADEPTGNLDSATSAEIIELLREVSQDKLLIMVTHNFEQVEHIATRHIRIFDGTVESDHVIKRPISSQKQQNSTIFNYNTPKRSHEVKNGVTLGLTIFKSKPRLSFFMCLLLLIATLGTFLITSSSSEMTYLFQDTYMFNHIDGRVVIVRRDGRVLTEDELKELCTETGAESYIRFDSMLDDDDRCYNYYNDSENVISGELSIDFSCTYGKDYGEPDIGRYPEKPNEALLYAPISAQLIYGKSELKNNYVTLYNMDFDVVGIKYYYDNNIPAEALLTWDGYRNVTAAYAVSQKSDIQLQISFPDAPKEYVYSFTMGLYGSNIYITDEIEDGKLCYADETYLELLEDIRKANGLDSISDVKQQLLIDATFYSFDYNYSYDSIPERYTKYLDESYVTFADSDVTENDKHTAFVISPSLLTEIIEDFLSQSYAQASLFYKNDAEASKALDLLSEKGYIPVLSSTTCEPQLADVILGTISAVGTAFIWVLTILFLAFFVNLCTSRAIGAFKGEMAIMRSMGIRVKVIKIGMYVRMLISLIPAFICVIAVAVGIFTSPKLNAMFSYMYLWQYAVIFIGMILLVSVITHKQIHRLFGESVKKSLKGGNEQ